jgi:hypothetical protein
MPESLLNFSGILLFGRPLDELALVNPDPCNPDPSVPGRMGANSFLEKQLRDPKSKFARIYGFSYEGSYFDLHRPAVFLVHGDGMEVEELPSLVKPGRRYSRAPDTPDKTGMASYEGGFAQDIRVWSYDRADFTLRLDIESGSFDEMLLSYETDDDWAHYSGAVVTGGKVGGGKVGGGKVGGGKVGGGKVGARRGRKDE